MYQRSDLRSQALDLLRFPLAVGVVAAHTFPYFAYKLDGQLHEPTGSLLFLTSFINGFVSGPIVPIFFFISGFVFFINFELTKESYSRKLKNRVRTLLVPYLIWNTLSIILLVITMLPIFENFSSHIHRELNFSLSNILSCFWNYNKELVNYPSEAYSYVRNAYPINGPLWFVRDLMVVVLFTPLLYRVLKSTKLYGIAVLGIAWAIIYYRCFQSNIMLRDMSTAFFFFSFGAYMSINRKDMLFELGRFRILSMVLYPLLCILSMIYFPKHSTIIMELRIVIGLFFAYNMAAWLLKKKICKVSPMLASASFFIYVSHSLIIKPINKILLVILRPSSEISMSCTCLLRLLLTIVLILAIYLFLKRYCPRALKILTGRK